MFFNDLGRSDSETLPVSAVAPRSDWSAMNQTEHFVQLYEADAYLLDSLSGFISFGLNAGDACVVVATRALPLSQPSLSIKGRAGDPR